MHDRTDSPDGLRQDGIQGRVGQANVNEIAMSHLQTAKLILELVDIGGQFGAGKPPVAGLVLNDVLMRRLFQLLREF